MDPTEDYTPEQITAVQAKLREWLNAADELPDPPDHLVQLQSVGYSIVDLATSHRSNFSDERAYQAHLEDKHTSIANFLDLVRDEVLKAREELRRRADRLAAKAARVDVASPPGWFERSLTGREAETWNEATEKARSEARRRLEVLSKMEGYDSTGTLEARIEEYREEHPEKPLSVSTFYRWRTRLREDGIPGLLPDW